MPNTRQQAAGIADCGLRIADWSVSSRNATRNAHRSFNSEFRNPKSEIRNGFTLIELLIVIAIIGVLVALVVGVGSWVRDKASRDQTAGRQEMIMLAITAYYDASVGKSRDKAYPAQGNTGSTPADIEARCQKLYEQLMDVEASRDRLAGLPADAIDSQKFIDAYGNPMDYRSGGGVGGVPVIISAGADGDFAKDDDNIRSDKL